jgi:hypothetical protein
MTALRKTIAAGALLLLASAAWAEDAHHPAADAGGTAAAEPAKPGASAGGGMMGNMMSGNMMSGGMMSDGMMKMMMDMMSGGDGPMGQMMSPGHIEGRIAFLETELKLTEQQRPLWKAVAEALRANAQAAKDMMAAMPGDMMSGAAAGETPMQRIELHERMLSTRLEGLGRLKAALGPLYAALDESQKAVADKLLMPAPMGMM